MTDSPETPSSPTLGKTVCPSCGISVAAGYANCPKCKEPLEQRRASTIHTRTGGGTSSSTGRTISWSLILAMAVITAVGWHLAQREEPEVRGEAIPNIERRFDGGLTDEGDPTLAEPLPPANSLGAVEQAQDALLTSLYDALAAAEVYAWLDVDHDDATQLDMHSLFCDDDRLATVVKRLAPSLKAQFSKIRCVTRFGRVVFERKLD